MANIILDEKRAVRIGEVCAVSLKDINPMYLTLEDAEMYGVDNDINFYSTGKGISSDGEITFVKYIGNGMFMDLVSDQLLLTELANVDDFGTDDFLALDETSKDEIIKMCDFWHSVQNPNTKLEFSNSFSVFMQNPLVINISPVSPAPFMSINSENAKKFASQSLEQLKTKMMSAKAMAQQGLKEQYSQYEGRIAERISAVERESAPKTM